MEREKQTTSKIPPKRDEPEASTSSDAITSPNEREDENVVATAPLSATTTTTTTNNTFHPELGNDYDRISHIRCSIRSCLHRTYARSIQCAINGCDRTVHPDCYQQLILVKHGVPHFDVVAPSAEDGKVVCTKKHYDLAQKQFGVSRWAVCQDLTNRNVPWTKDGKGGECDPENSMNILLRWIATPGNYDQFCSGHGGKLSTALIIAKHINDSGVVKERTAKSILAKIDHLEGQWKNAHHWALRNGRLVMERDGHRVYETELKERCPYYFDLLDVFAPYANMDAMPPDIHESTASVISPEFEMTPQDEDMMYLHNDYNLDNDSRSLYRFNNGFVPNDDDDDDEELSSKKNPNDRKSMSAVGDNKFKKKPASRLSLPPSDFNKKRKLSFPDCAESREWETKLLKLEHEKLNLELKDKELRYKVSLLEEYKKLTDKDFSDDMILAILPDMHMIINAKTKTTQDNSDAKI